MQRSSLVILAIGVVIVGGLIYAASVVGNDQQQPTSSITETEDFSMDQATELIQEDIKVGDGDEAEVGSTITVHYDGTLLNGTKFDSSRDRGQPFTLVLGQGQVIQGWEQGLVGMKVGGIRKLTIPPELGYGSQAQGSIPPNSTLVFEVELLEVQ